MATVKSFIGIQIPVKNDVKSIKTKEKSPNNPLQISALNGFFVRIENMISKTV